MQSSESGNLPAVMKPSKRYSGVLSLFGENQWFTMNAELSADDEFGTVLSIYKKSPEDSSCVYRFTVDLTKVCAVLSPDVGKSDGLHLLLLVTLERECHMISALSEVERDNWARELTQIVGKGHSFPVTLPTLNSFSCKQATMYYNSANQMLLMVSRTNSPMERCEVLAMWHHSDLKSFGASASSLVIQTKKSASGGATHLCFRTPLARRIVNLLHNRCQKGCNCCNKPHPFSQMADASLSSSSTSGSETDEEPFPVNLEPPTRIGRHRSVDDITMLKVTSSSSIPGARTLFKKKAVTIDRPSGNELEDSRKPEKPANTILQSFIFSPQQMDRYKLESLSAQRTKSPDAVSVYEEVKAKEQRSLYEEIPEDLKRHQTAPRSSASEFKSPAEGSSDGEALRASMNDESFADLVYERMSSTTQRQTSSPFPLSSSPLPSSSSLVSGNPLEDSYVAMHSLSNRSSLHSSLSLKPVSSDGQIVGSECSSPAFYANTMDKRTYSNLEAVADSLSTNVRNLAYVEISDNGKASTLNGVISRESSPSPVTSYIEVDHQLTEALRKTAQQRRQVCRAQTLDTSKHKKVSHKKWLSKLAAKKV